MRQFVIVAAACATLVGVGGAIDHFQSPGAEPVEAVPAFVPPTPAEAVDGYCLMIEAGKVKDTDEMIRTVRELLADGVLPSATWADYLERQGEFKEVASASPDVRKEVADRFRSAAPKEWFDGSPDRLLH